MAGDKILVTGASGFVGAAVARAALASGYAVRALVRAASARIDALMARAPNATKVAQRGTPGG